MEVAVESSKTVRNVLLEYNRKLADNERSIPVRNSRLKLDNNYTVMADAFFDRNIVFESKGYREWRSMMEWQFKANGQFAVATDLTIVDGFKALSYAQQEGQEGEEFQKANFSACFTIMK